MSNKIITNNQTEHQDRKRNFLINAFALAYLSALIIAMIAYGPSLIFYLLFALLAAAFILPDRAILGLSLIIVLTMVFERYFTLQGLIIDRSILKFYLLDIVFCLSALALIINHKFKSGPKNKFVLGAPEKILLLWLILVGAYLIRGTLDLNADFDLVFSSFKNYFFYPLLYFFVIYAIDDAKKFKSIIHLILLTAVGLISFIVFGLANGTGLWTEFTPLSTFGTRYLAGTHAFYLALAGAIALPLVLYGRLRNKSFAFAILGIWLIGIAGSLMRHLWLAVAMGLSSTIILIDQQLKKTLSVLLLKSSLIAITTITVILLGASLLYFQGSAEKIYQDFYAVQTRIATVSNLSGDSSVAWRQNVWTDAKKIWDINPIFGIGFGHVIMVDSGSFQDFVEIRNIHNSLLSIMTQMGLIGIIAFLAFILTVVITSIKNIYLNNDLKPYYLGLLSALTVYLTACLFQPYLETNLMSIWLWIILGLLRTASIYENPANK